MQVILTCEGIRLGRFYLPPFVLHQGELIGIHLRGGMHYANLKQELSDILSGKTPHTGVRVHHKIACSELFQEHWLRRYIFPMRVKEYLHKKANPDSVYFDLIYQTTFIQPDSVYSTLAEPQKRLLNLYALISHNPYFIFDTDGIWASGMDLIFSAGKQAVLEGRAALYFDWSPDFEPACTRMIHLEVN